MRIASNTNRLFPLPQGIPTLLITGMIMYLGYYALIPYLSYHLTHSLLITPALVGLLLSVRQLSQQGITFLTGMLADRLGYKPMMCIGMAIRGIGFALFGVVSNVSLLFAAAVFAGLGGALFEPPREASLSALTPPEERTRVFAIKKVLNNIGIALSAVLGGVLIAFDFRWLSLVCGASYLIAAGITYFALPDIKAQITALSFRNMWRNVLGDRPFLKFVFCITGYNFLYLQMFFTIPLQAVAITGSVQAVSTINLALAVIIVFCQYPITRSMSRWHPIRAIQAGLLLMALGLLLLGTAQGWVLFTLSVTLFALGMMIVEPAEFDVIAGLAKPELAATYFGFASVALAVGGSVAQGTSGYLMQFGQEIGLPSLLWWVSAAVAAASISGLQRLMKHGQKALSR
jgi:DHA1 family multidrug resistance protein-like MFS transporter